MIGFSYPVVPQGKARIRTQMSAAHTAGADRPGGRGVREGRPGAGAFAAGQARPHGVSATIRDRGKGHDEGTRQAGTRAGTRAHAREEAGGRPQRRADPHPQDGDLRHRHPHLEVGRLGAEDHSGARCTSATNTSARSSRSGRRCAASRSATACPARATSPAASAATAAPAGATCAATPWASASTAQGAFAEYLVIPAFNAFKIPDDISDDLAAIFDPFGNATHTALVVRPGRRGRAHHRRRTHRHHGRGDRAPRRRAPCGDHRRQRLPARPGAAKMGATRAVNVGRENLHDVMTELGMTRRLRRRHGDVRRAGRRSRRCSST